MHVECAARRELQQRERQHVPVVETEDHVGPCRLHPREHLGRCRIGRHDAGDAALGAQCRDRAEPDRLGRIVLVRHHQRHLDAARQQHLQAAHADIVIGKNDCAHRP